MRWIRRTALLAATAAIVVLAQSWSDYMAVTGNYSHQDLDAVLQNPAYAGYSGLGENILHGGCGITATQMDQAWMNSPEHRANILGNFSAVRIGVACNRGDLYATQQFR